MGHGLPLLVLGLAQRTGQEPLSRDMGAKIETIRDTIKRCLNLI